jgi:hypothetical protein
MKYIIEQKVNPFDEWKKFKVFKDLKKAEQSLDTLIKHRFSLFKNTEYEQYRLVTK